MVPAPKRVGSRYDETAVSVLTRVAVANGMRDIGHLLRSTPHMRAGQVHNREHRVELAARLGGFDVERLDEATPVRMTYRSIQVRGGLFRQAGPPAGRLCPVCIERDLATGEERRPELRPFRRDWWQIPAVTTCPLHSTALLTSCPRCGLGYDERRPAARCGCGEPITSGERIDPADCAHDAWLLGRVGVIASTRSPFLDSMPVDTAAELCRIVGKAVSTVSSRKAAGEDAASAARVRTVGWNEISDGLGGLERLLDGIVARERGRGLRCNTSYAGLHPFLTRNQCPSLDPVRALLASHAANNLGLGGSNARLFNRTAFAGDRVSIARVAEALDVAERRLIAIHASLCPEEAAAVEATGLMSQAGFGLLRDAVRNSMRTSELKELLGFNQRLLLAATDANLLDFLLPGERTFGLVRRGSVEALLRRFERPPVASASGLLGPEAFARAARVSAADVMRAVASDRLRPAGRRRDRKGFLGLLFRAEDAAGLRPAMRGEVTKARALSELGWLAQTLSALRSRELLDVGSGQTVTLAALATFRRDWACPAEAYEWLATPGSFLSFCHLLRRRCGRPVVSGPGVTPFWSRALLEEELRPVSSPNAIIHATGFGSFD